MNLGTDDVAAFTLTVKLATVTTLILLVVSVPLAWWLARSQWRGKVLLEAVVALPLVLPPTVLGFYLLVAFGGQSPLGKWYQNTFGGPLVFSFEGLVVGSLIYSLPFVVQPIRNAFESIGRRPLEVAATLRASPWDAFFSVALPMARPGILTAMVLGFAHTVGEFGVVLMIGGSIPNETRVLSIAIYDHVEALNYQGANSLSLILVVFSFVLLVLVYSLNPRARQVWL